MAIPRTPPSGIFGSGYAPAAAQPLDLGSIIDAVTNGASSLIHGAYLRKVAERNAAIAEETRKATAAQQKFERDRLTARDKFDRDKADREFQLRERELQQKASESGVVPPKTVVPPGSPLIPAGITLPAHYDPDKDVSLRRSRALRASPTGRTPAEIPGTPEHLAAITAEAEARARAGAKYRRPESDPEIASQRIAIRQAVQEARRRYLEGDRDRMGRGALSPLEANRRALEDAIEIYGEQAVRDAIGAQVNKLKAPALGTRYTPETGGTPLEIQDRSSAPAAPRALRAPVAPAPAAAAPVRVAPLARPAAPAAPVAAPVAAPSGPPALAPMSEAQMSDADLWEYKRRQGLSPAAATAYVRARQGRFAPEDEDAPTGAL